ncbi:hypothetical protein BDW75DRAFT_246504 [Aspergillus navahoensis]
MSESYPYPQSAERMRSGFGFSRMLPQPSQDQVRDIVQLNDFALDTDTGRCENLTTMLRYYVARHIKLFLPNTKFQRKRDTGQECQQQRLSGAEAQWCGGAWAHRSQATNHAGLKVRILVL